MERQIKEKSKPLTMLEPPSASFGIVYANVAKEQKYSSDSEGCSGCESPVTPLSFLESARSSCVEEVVEAMGDDVECYAEKPKLSNNVAGIHPVDMNDSGAELLGAVDAQSAENVIDAGRIRSLVDANLDHSPAQMNSIRSARIKRNLVVALDTEATDDELEPDALFERAQTELPPASHRKDYQDASWQARSKGFAEQDWMASARECLQYSQELVALSSCSNYFDEIHPGGALPIDATRPTTDAGAKLDSAQETAPRMGQRFHRRSSSFSGRPSAEGECQLTGFEGMGGRQVARSGSVGGRARRGMSFGSDREFNGLGRKDEPSSPPPLSAGVTELIMRELEKQSTTEAVAPADVEALYRQESGREILSRQNSSDPIPTIQCPPLPGHHRRRSSGSVGSWLELRAIGDGTSPGTPSTDGASGSDTPTGPAASPGSDSWNGIQLPDAPSQLGAALENVPAGTPMIAHEGEDVAACSSIQTPEAPRPPTGVSVRNESLSRQSSGEGQMADVEIPAWARIPVHPRANQRKPRAAKALSRRRMARASLERPMAAVYQPMAGPKPGEDGRFVTAVVGSLGKGPEEDQREISAIVRGLIKKQPQNKRALVQARGIPALVSIMKTSNDSETLEHAVTTLLNVSHSELIEEEVASVGGFEAIVRVVKIGSATAKANAAAAIFALGGASDHKVTFCKAGAILPLLRLILGGTLRGKKDAALALYQLSLSTSCATEMAECGGVMALMGTLIEGGEGLEEKVAAVFANLAMVPEGRAAMEEQGAIPQLVDIVEEGSARAKEDCVGALFQLANNSSAAFDMIHAEGMMPSLQVLSEKGTSRAKAKSKALMGLLRAAGSSSEDSNDLAVGVSVANAPILLPPPVISRRRKSKRSMPSCLGW